MDINENFTIRLEKLRFFAFHGLYDQEKKNGNEFELDLTLCIKPPVAKITKLEHTLNYVAVYELVQQEMQQPRELMETLLQELAQSLKSRFSEIAQIDLTIYKLTAPIAGLNGRVGVRFSKIFKD